MSFGKRKRDDDYDDFEKSIKYSETQDLSTAYKFIDEEEEYQDSLNFSIVTTPDEGESTKKPEDNLYDSIIAHEEPPNLKRQQENHQNTLALIQDLKGRFLIEKILDDGNCFFHSVLKALNSESENYMDLRNAGCCFLMENIISLLEKHIVEMK